jgi:hypothetical protein
MDNSLNKQGEESMTDGLIRRAAMLLAAALTVVGIALAAGSSTAAAQPFCAGANVGPNQPCFGGARVLTVVSGKGNTHAICVGADATRGQCVPSNTWANWNSGSTGNKVPWIEWNPPGSGLTIVSGDTT